MIYQGFLVFQRLKTLIGKNILSNEANNLPKYLIIGKIRSLKQVLCFCIIERLRGERMLKPKSRWIVKQSDQSKTESLAKELNIHHITASLLVNRGLETVEDARYFLFGQKSQFHDPFLMKDMDKAVARIRQAVETEEQILVYGDYDADGVSSTTVMLKSLLEIGANVDYYIPNRFTEGYGPNELAFKKAAERGVGLIITVDTGISAIHEAQVAIDLGLDLIITDHHEPGPVLPNAFAIIHPKLEDSLYPFKDLAGVGVALKLAHALLGRLPEHLFELDRKSVV